MPTPTPVLGLNAAVATDLEPTYLTTDLAASLTVIDTLFSPTAGHDHSATGTGGAPIDPATAIPPASITTAQILNPFTQPEIATPTLPADLPALGSWRIYPKTGTSGQYFKVDSTGAESPLVIQGGVPDPLTIGTIIVTAAATLPAIQQAGIATPLLAAYPPAGSFLLYPKVDGLYYRIDSAGVETRVGAETVVPPTALTGSMRQIGSTMISQIIDALVAHGIADDTAVTP